MESNSLRQQSALLPVVLGEHATVIPGGGRSSDGVLDLAIVVPTRMRSIPMGTVPHHTQHPQPIDQSIPVMRASFMRERMLIVE